MDSISKPKLLVWHKVSQPLFYITITTFLLSMAIIGLWVSGFMKPQNKEQAFLVLAAMIASFTLLYPSVSLFGMTLEPEKFFSEYLGKHFIPATALWVIYTIGTLLTILRPFWTPENADISLDALQKARDAFFPVVCIVAVSTVISILCLAVVCFYRNYYRNVKMLPAEETK